MKPCDLSLAQILNFCTKTVIQRCAKNKSQLCKLSWWWWCWMDSSLLFSACSALRCSYLRHIRAANSVNLKRPIDAKKNNSISDHNDLGEVDATQNIIISSCFFFFVSLPIISIYFACRKHQNRAWNWNEMLFFFVLFRFSRKKRFCWKIDLNWIILITRVDFYEWPRARKTSNIKKPQHSWSSSRLNGVFACLFIYFEWSRRNKLFLNLMSRFQTPLLSCASFRESHLNFIFIQKRCEKTAKTRHTNSHRKKSE